MYNIWMHLKMHPTLPVEASVWMWKIHQIDYISKTYFIYHKTSRHPIVLYPRYTARDLTFTHNNNINIARDRLRCAKDNH
jgi:hypothetical protein